MRRVVISGVGVISPVGNTIPVFWDNIIEGRPGIGQITKFDISDMKVKIAAEVKDFSPEPFYTSKSDIKRSDLFTQYAVAATELAMIDSGLKDYDNNRLGVYVGSGIGGISTFMNETYKLRDLGPRRVSPVFIPMMISNMASGMIAIKYGAKGPTLPVITACATSSNAIGEAFRAIKHGYADIIIAGGSEAAVNKLAVAGFTSSTALSESVDPLRSSIPFDAKRDGFVIGEGAGIVLLEEYEAAKKRGAKIYAEVCGYGNTCDAYHITAPSPDAEAPARAMTLAMEEAGITASDCIYINAHGTSTPLNDKTETMAIKKALGEKAYSTPISSSKSMTGHMLGAAGAVEIIVSALAISHGIVPPTAGYENPDSECDLDYVPNTAREVKLDAAISNSLGFGGHNATVVLRKI